MLLGSVMQRCVRAGIFRAGLLSSSVVTSSTSSFSTTTGSATEAAPSGGGRSSHRHPARAKGTPRPPPVGLYSRPPPTIMYTDLRDNPGARTRVRRKGRGVGSGHGLGRSAGLGTRGQRSHGGGLANTFEGGQSPLWRRTPKFGQMHKMFRKELEPLNLDRLQLWIDTGRIDPTKLIDLRTLLQSGCLSHIKHGVKLLANGAERWTAQGVQLEVTAASGKAISAVERAGKGSVLAIYRTRLALHAHLHPERYSIPIRSPRPPPSKLPYYTAFKNRGYLSSRVQLERLKKRLAGGGEGGEGGRAPTMLMPLFEGGAVSDKVILDIEVGAGSMAGGGKAAQQQ